MKEQIPIRFFAVTFLWTWAFWSPFVLAGIGVYELDEGISSIAAMPAAYLGAFGPAVGALYSVWTLKGKGAVIVFLKSFLSLRFGWTAWVAIFAVLGLVNFAAWYIPELFGYERLPMLLPSIFVFPVWWLLMLFLGGGQEEIGWRGYILSPLESRFGLVGGNVVLGLIWTCWHIPLWFIAGTNQSYMPFMAFAVGLVGQSFFFSWVIKASGGRPLSGLIAHATNNAFVPLFPTIITEPDVEQTRWWLHQIMLLVVGALFILSLTRKSARTSKAGVMPGHTHYRKET